MQTPEQRLANELRENYLAEVTDILRQRLQPIETYESVEEIRAHLNTMALAHEELGLDSVAAMRTSLEKFGPAGEIGSSLATVPTAQKVSLIHQALPPLILFATIFVSTAAAFILFVAVGWFVAGALHSETLPLDITAELSWVGSVLVSTLAWMFRRWKPIGLGLFVTGVMNVILGITLYPVFINNGDLTHFPHHACTLTLSTFLLGYAVSSAIKKIDVKILTKRLPGSVA